MTQPSSEPKAKAPPKLLRQWVAGESIPSDPTMAVQTRPVTAIDAGGKSLPVLEAFQEFLEAERERTRKKMRALITSFVVLLLLLAGTVGGLAYFLMNRVNDDLDDVRGRFGDLRKISLQTRNDAGKAMDMAKEETERLRKEMEQKRLADVRAAEQRLSDQAKHTRTQMRELDRELARFDEVLRMLELENTTLRADLGTVESRVLTLASPPSARVTPSSPTTTVAFSITPRGADRPSNWLLPLP